MRRHLAMAVAATLIVLTSSTHSDAETRRQPDTTTSSPQKQLCDAVLNMCVSDCYEVLGTEQQASRTCTTNCTNQYHRCKKTGKI